MIQNSITNLEHNFKKTSCQHSMYIIIEEHPCVNNANKTTGSCNLTQYLRNIQKRGYPDGKDERHIFITIDELVTFFKEDCLRNFLLVDGDFATYYIHLLIRDARHSLELNYNSQAVNICKVEQFLLTALEKYKNPTDATVCCLKMDFYCKMCKELILNCVKEKYQLEFNDKLKQLINSILQYPETSNNFQLEDMFFKMQVFILANYQIGHPHNHMLLKQCRQSLNSILGKGDIQKYVLKKRYHRLEYLQKLGSTAAGILIYNNNHGEGEDNENIRNIFADLKMAKCNTKESLQEGLERVLHLKQKGYEVVTELIDINIVQKSLHCLRPLAQIQDLNKFVVLFELYRRNLEKARNAFEKTQHLMEVDQKKFDFVVEKINDILKYRSAIESELIFPHFVYLSEIWSSLVMYLNHLVEINKIKDHLDDLCSKEMEHKFNELVENLSDKNKHLKHTLNYSFEDVMTATTVVYRESNLNMLNIKPFVKDYCALTLALTGGILIPSQVQKKLCENIDFHFGFKNKEYAKLAEHQFKNVIKMFRSTILSQSDLIVLFELDSDVMQQHIDMIHQTQVKSKSLDTQTDMTSNKMPKSEIAVTWNIWGFHRQTIKMANIRKRQTHSTQSDLSYGLRNAQTQCDKKSNV